MSWSASGCWAPTIIVVMPLSFQASSRSAMRSFGPMSADLVDQLVGHRGDRLALVALEVQVLDLLGRVLEAVAAREVVVEVLAARAHAADVERGHRLHEAAQHVDVVADDDA